MVDTGRISWGIVGTSGFAGNFFAPALKEAENAELVAVCGRDAEKSRGFAKKMEAASAYGSVEELAGDEDVEAVWIASPNHMHKEHAVTLLRAGKHVLCEKPLATTAADCREIASEAEQADRLLTVGYNMRQDPILKWLHKRWNRGEFGNPALLRINRFHAYPDHPPEWRTRRSTSGGWSINDIGTHLIDQCLWFMGRAERVTGHLATRRFEVETDDLSVVTISCENGGLASLESSTALPAGRPRVELYGTEGYAVAELARLACVVRLIEGRNDGAPEIRNFEESNLFVLEAEAFGRAVRGLEPPAVTPEEAARNVEIIERARGF
jgi:1,5-anhydro-D-fructose reductase (1,5-anhydro-D-mannitol-forming)